MIGIVLAVGILLPQIEVDRRGDGSTVVETPRGTVTVVTHTEGRPGSSKSPGASRRITKSRIEKVLEDRHKVENEWT